jgi:hypothetical protein
MYRNMLKLGECSISLYSMCFLRSFTFWVARGGDSIAKFMTMCSYDGVGHPCLVTIQYICQKSSFEVLSDTERFRQVVYEDLAKAREAFVLASDLHLLYEVTPTYVDLEPDWGVYYSRFMELPPLDQVCKISMKLCFRLIGYH